MNIRASVSQIEQYRQWRDAEEESLEGLFSRLWSVDNVNTLRGKAFHRCMERVHRLQAVDCLQADGYTFYFDLDVELPAPSGREVSLVKPYGSLDVSARIDGGTGKTVTEYKTTSSFDADRYQLGYQWRYYLDMAEADRLDWHIFEVTPLSDRPQEYEVRAYHPMSQWRYPDLHADCERLANDFYRLIIDTPELLEAYRQKQLRTA